MKKLKLISILGIILAGVIFSFFGFFYLFSFFSENDITLDENDITSDENDITLDGGYITKANNIVLDSSNNIYITGSISVNETETTDAFLAKFDNNGNIIWYKIWGGIYDDSGSGIAFDSSGNVYMGGSTASFGSDVANANWFLAKFDNAGNQIWNYSWGTNEGEWGGKIAVDSSDFIYYIGSTWGHGGPSANVGLVKFNSTGGIQWARYWGIGGYDSPRGLVIDSSDNIYIIAGSDNRGFGGRDVALIKYNSAGTLLWDIAWGSSGYDDPRGITLDNLGNIYITGVIDSYGAGDYDIFILKYDSVPILLWNFTWGGVDSDIAQDLVLDTSNNIYLTGYTESFGSGKSDIVSIKFNSLGSQQWNKTWGGTDIEESYGISIDSSNNTYIAGWSDSFNAITSNALILKCNSTGDAQWYKSWDGE